MNPARAVFYDYQLDDQVCVERDLGEGGAYTVTFYLRGSARDRNSMAELLIDTFADERQTGEEA